MTTARTTQTGALARLTGEPQTRTTQTGALARLTQPRTHLTQTGVLLRLEPEPHTPPPTEIYTTQTGALARLHPPETYTTQTGALARLHPPETYTTQTGALARLTGEPKTYTTQTGALARLTGEPKTRITQTGALLRLTLPPIPNAGASTAPQPAAQPSPSPTLNGAPATPTQIAAAIEAALHPSPPPLSQFTAEIYDRTGAPPLLLQRLHLTPLSYSAKAVGGPDAAQIAVHGDANDLAVLTEWLGYRILIRNPNGNIVWLGYIHTAEIQHNAVTIGRTLEHMANRIAVDYTDDAADATPQNGRTPWLDDLIAQTRYGVKEELLSLADATPQMAAAFAATELAARSQPTFTLDLAEPADPQNPKGILHCRGYWSQLDWRFYADPTGKHTRINQADLQHALGYTRTATTIGFKETHLHDLAARLHELPTDQTIAIDGAAQPANNGDLQLSRPPQTDHIKTYTAATISFDPFDDILDSAAGLGLFDVGEMIAIDGAAQPANNGVRFIKTKQEDDARLEVSPGALVAEPAGAAVTLTQGHSAAVIRPTAFTREPAGAAVTLTPHGDKLAQFFRLPNSWTVRQVAIQARRIGQPAPLRFSLYTDHNNAPHTQLVTTTLPANAVPTTLDWILAEFPPGPALAPNTPYWLLVEIDSTLADDQNYYFIGLDSTLADPDGHLLIHHNNTWIPRTPNADMPYQLWGLLPIQEQLQRMLTAADLFTAISVSASGNLQTRHHRPGDQRIRTEIERLLAIGDNNATPLVATVQPGPNGAPIALITNQPPPDDTLLLTPDGQLIEALRQTWEPGVLPVARWITLVGLPTPYARHIRLYIDEAEYNIQSGQLRLTPRHQPNPWTSPNPIAAAPQSAAQLLKPYL